MGGTSLFMRAISTATKADVDRVIVSTEDPEIRQVALDAGVEVPFVRPAGASVDDASLIDVLRHALFECEAAGDSVGVVCSLQVTAPFLSQQTVNRCLSRFRLGTWDSAVTVRQVLHNHPYRAYDRDGDGRLLPLFPEGEGFLQRQDLPQLFALSGGFYVRRAALIRGWSGRDFALGSRCLGVPVSEREGLNIDTPMDLELARLLVDRRVTS